MSIDHTPRIAATTARPSTSAPGSTLRWRLGSVFVLLVVFSALLAPAASATPADESSFVAQVNQYRAAQGLPALQVDGQLTSLARNWSTQMRSGACGAGNHICHASPISAGVTHNWAKLGENVGTGGDVNSVMQAFINSEGHRNNIVDPEFTHIGVGVVWQDGRLYTTHRFMSLQGAPPATTTTTAAPATTAPPASTTSPPVPPTTAAAPATTASPVAPEQDPSNGADDRPAGAPPATVDRVAIVLTALVALT